MIEESDSMVEDTLCHTLLGLKILIFIALIVLDENIFKLTTVCDFKKILLQFAHVGAKKFENICLRIKTNICKENICFY